MTATVTLQVGPDPSHVRVVRLVAAAIARRAGVSEEAVDEVRLAVGEACGMAVSALADDGDNVLSVDFEDTSGLDVVVRVPVDLGHQSAPEGDPGPVPDGLDVIRALLDDVSISTGSDESVVSMHWPVAVG